MELAPIAFFAYNRPDHTLKGLTSLAQCELADRSHLHIFCDGPKNVTEIEQISKVRKVANSKQWCAKVNIIASEKNMGLANSIISGASTLCEQYGRVIVIEDDLILAPGFLDYMNSALDKYEQAEEVVQISGYMFPVTLTADYDAIFLPFTTTWGWATWWRAWRNFDPQMSGYEPLFQDKTLKYKFDLCDSYPYLDMLEQQLAGKIDSWGIRWYLSTFLRGGLTLHPLKSLVQNIGFDGSGAHCGVTSVFAVPSFPARIERLPEQVVIDSRCFAEITRHLKSNTRMARPSLKQIIKRTMRFFNKHLGCQP
jgi:hypothetical protein